MRRVLRRRAPVAMLVDALVASLVATLVVVASMLALPTAQAASATLQRQAVQLGESVRLVIRFDGEADVDGFDASLLAGDFHLLGTSTRSRVEVVNGTRSATTELLVDLMPRREGVLTIPSLPFADGNTEPLSLTVLAAADAGSADVLLEVSAEPDTVYVQAPVQLAVRLLYRRSLLEGNLSDPSIEDALVRRQGDDRQYSARRGGESYRVIERRFVVFPGRSGELHIPALRFVGLLAADAGDGLGGFGLFRGGGRRVGAESQPLTIEVLPPPPGAPSPWFPANDVRLSEDWGDDPVPVFRVGEPVTRRLRVEALGASGEQVPPLAPGTPEGMRSYPDKPVLHTGSRDGHLLGVREQSLALVPTRAGRQVLPAVEVHFWDTAADRARVARLPAREIEVLPAPADVTPALPGSEPSSPPATPVPAGEVVEPSPPGSAWPWLAALFALGWAVTAMAWWRQRRGAVARAPTPAADRQPAVPSPSRAFRQHDPRLAREALLHFARRCWPADPPTGLQALAARLGDEARAPLQALDAACYGEAGDFDGEALHRRLSPLLKAARGDVADDAREDLPPLYPEPPPR